MSDPETSVLEAQLEGKMKVEKEENRAITATNKAWDTFKDNLNHNTQWWEDRAAPGWMQCGNGHPSIEV